MVERYLQVEDNLMGSEDYKSEDLFSHKGVNIFSTRRIHISPMEKIRLLLSLRMLSPR
jgi:hypothetical protein